VGTWVTVWIQEPYYHFLQTLRSLRSTLYNKEKENWKFAGLLYTAKNESFLTYFMCILNSCVI